MNIRLLMKRIVGQECSIGSGADVYFAAGLIKMFTSFVFIYIVVEYFLFEIIELARKEESNKTAILEPSHIYHAITSDVDLNKLFSSVIIPMKFVKSSSGKQTNSEKFLRISVWGFCFEKDVKVQAEAENAMTTISKKFASNIAENMIPFLVAKKVLIY